MQTDFERIYRGLYFFLAGLTFCILDYKFESFDVLPDPIGAGLILFALWELSKIKVNQAYKFAINLTTVATIVGLLFGVGTYVYSTPSIVLLIIKAAVELFLIYGFVMFARAMQIYAKTNDLSLSAEKWKSIEKLYFWLYFIILGILGYIVLSPFVLSLFNALLFLLVTIIGRLLVDTVETLSIMIVLLQIIAVIKNIILMIPVIQTLKVVIGMKKEMSN